VLGACNEQLGNYLAMRRRADNIQRRLPRGSHSIEVDPRFWYPGSPVAVPIDSSILSFPAFAICDQIHSIAQKRLGPEVGYLEDDEMELVGIAIERSLFPNALRPHYSGDSSLLQHESGEPPLIVKPKITSAAEEEK
jgi:hypothetical protein